MELEEIISRLDFLEDERRKSGHQTSALERRLSTLEATVKSLQKEIAGFGEKMTEFISINEKVDQFDSALVKIRKDVHRSIQNIEKVTGTKTGSTTPMDIGSFNKLVFDLRKGLSTINGVKKDLQVKANEDLKIAKTVAAMQSSIKSGFRLDDEFRENFKVVEETQRQDSKRVADLLSEVTSLRKKIDDNKGRWNLSSEKLKDLESKFVEFQNSELDRKQSLVGLIEKQNLQQVERNRIWKEWQNRFDNFSEKAQFAEKQTQNLEVTLQSLRAAQEKFEDINQRLERRINELTEMQRLTEEKFRQDWMSFRAEDQKRWANYNVGQDELQRETARQLENTLSRLSSLEELSQDIRDAIASLGRETNQRLQSLIKMSNEWMDSNDRLVDLGA
jgi:DNA repair exonuclease SbcCD ATPase subunit